MGLIDQHSRLFEEIDQQPPDQAEAAVKIDELRLRPDRADVILPAALVYRYFAKLVQAERIVVPGVGVKEGVLLDVATSLRQDTVSPGWQQTAPRG